MLLRSYYCLFSSYRAVGKVSPAISVTAATAAISSSSRTGRMMMSTSAAAATPIDKTNGSIRYNFWRGHPNNDLLPAIEMQQILQHMASPTNQERLKTSIQYLGSDRGDPALLQEISLFLRRHTLDDEVIVPVVVPQDSSVTTTTAMSTAENKDKDNAPSPSDDELDLFLTHGVSHGLDMLCTAQTTTGDVVLIERPSYFLAANIFRSHGLQIQSLPMKRQGILGGENNTESSSSSGPLLVDVDALAQGLEDGSIGVPRMIYIIPTHQNPTANTMPLCDRWQLCQLARKFGFLVAADEVYHLLDWSEEEDKQKQRRRPARFSVLDHILSKSSKIDSCTSNNERQQLGCSVSVSSFTKIFTPGVRCGWIEGPTEIIESIVDVGYIQSQGGCAPFIGNVLRTALEEGFQDQILERLNASYKDRCRILCDILETAEPSSIRIRCRPTGGYFVWVDFLDLPAAAAETTRVVGSSTEEGADNSPASLFARYCLARGLKIMPGIKCDSVFDCFEQSGQPKELCQNSARLCFADMDVNDIADGARLLIQLHKEYTGKQ